MSHCQKNFETFSNVRHYRKLDNPGLRDREFRIIISSRKSSVYCLNGLFHAWLTLSWYPEILGFLETGFL